MKLIDTDIAIDHFHGHQAAVVTLTELMTGMRAGEEARTEGLLNLFSLLEIDESIARKAGEYLREFSRSHRLELGDALIAASAAIAGAELITRNIKHYPMSDIQVIAPYARGRS